MEDQERDEILYRVDERTEMMNAKMEVLADDMESNRKRIGKTKDLAQDNRMILNGMTFGISTVIATGAAQLTGFIKF